MAFHTEKEEGGKQAIVFDGFENGIYPSPHKGIANLQGVNIATEIGEAMASFNRVQQSQTGTTGTLTQVNTNTVSISGITLLVGQVITITSAGTTGLSGNYYYLSTGKILSGSTVPNDPSSATPTSGITAGSATFTITYPMAQPFQSATEVYTDDNGIKQARYYILDTASQIWCHDSATLFNWDTPLWFIVADLGSNYSGLAVYDGWLVAFRNDPGGHMQSNWGLTSTLANRITFASAEYAMTSPQTHVSLVSHDSILYVSDNTYLASFFATNSFITGAANIQSYCEYNAGTFSTIQAVINGSVPTVTIGLDIRIPAQFYAAGTLPAAITAGVTYYIEGSISGSNQFQFKVYAAASGGSALTMTSGATGRQFFNTFTPQDDNLFIYTPQRLNLPFNETVTALAETGTTVMIGGVSNAVYPWDQVAATPGDIIFLPENTTSKIITVNNMAYVFAGNKGNIYITNGSSASLALSVPDYCAGIPGNPQTYIEPYFSWGDAMYCRGRVYFSILDQTSTKAGTCGGIWSFVPTQNMFIGQDTGQALRLENQNSYGNYNGVATVLIPNQNQNAIGTQYWSGWYSDVTTPTYGIDYTGTIPTSSVVIETDLMPTGTNIDQKTFSQIEYKLSSPLVSGETVTVNYRQNRTDVWTSCGTVEVESATELSGLFTVNFEKGQWLQLQAVLTPLASTSSSFIPLNQLRIR